MANNRIFYACQAVFIGKNELENQKLSIKLLQIKSEQFEIDIDDMNQLKKILNS